MVYAACPQGKERNPASGRCRKIAVHPAVSRGNSAGSMGFHDGASSAAPRTRLQRLKNFAKTIGRTTYDYRWHLAYAVMLAAISSMVVTSRNQARTIAGLSERSGLSKEELRLVAGTMQSPAAKRELRKLAEKPAILEKALSMGLPGDLCQIDKKLCTFKGALPRTQMPQLNGVTPGDLAKGLLAKGLAIGANRRVPATTMIPMQSELQTRKVLGMAKAMINGKLDPAKLPVMVANTMEGPHVIDGHHRWAAAWLTDKAAVIRPVQATNSRKAASILADIKKLPGVTYAGL